MVVSIFKNFNEVVQTKKSLRYWKTSKRVNTKT